jgi:hypothetical protein
MSYRSFFEENKYTKNETSYIKKLIKEEEKNNFKEILLTPKKDLHKILKIKIENSTILETNEIIYKFKKFLLENFIKLIDVASIDDEVLMRIEKFNRLERGFLSDYKIFSLHKIDKKYSKSCYKLYKKIINEVFQNQIFKTKLDFNDKQKILAQCSTLSYFYPNKKEKIFEEKILDPKFKTEYIPEEEMSNIDRFIWTNEENSVFGKKIIIISYRGTGTFDQKKNFSFFGNWRSDFKNDLKILRGNFRDSKKMKEYIKDFEEILKKFGKKYKYFLTGHSLGGRIAFEIYRKKYYGIKECHIFNAGFGLDLEYYKDILKTKKRDYPWEKNIYNYHIGGKLKETTLDDDPISVLSGGYGKSYTFYENFNSYFAAHSINEFLK